MKLIIANLVIRYPGKWYFCHTCKSYHVIAAQNLGWFRPCRIIFSEKRYRVSLDLRKFYIQITLLPYHNQVWMWISINKTAACKSTTSCEVYTFHLTRHAFECLSVIPQLWERLILKIRPQRRMCITVILFSLSPQVRHKCVSESDQKWFR